MRNQRSGVEGLLGSVMRSDVAVVGAGPAGCATAILLARAGVDVTLLDRSEFPRPKPCGDCLSPNAARWLSDLGVLNDLDALEPARLEGWRIVAPGGTRLEARFDEMTDDALVSTAIAVSRMRLDAVLIDAARAAGARVRTGVRVTGLLADRCGVMGRGPADEPIAVEARLVVGADGLRSIVARRMGAVARPPRLRKLSLTAHLSGILLDHPYGEMHLADGMCVGLAPVCRRPDVACNVTLVVDRSRFSQRIAQEPIAFFMESLNEFGGMAGRLDDAVFLRSEQGAGRVPELLACGPFDVPTRRIAAPGLALVGDAAGYYDPFTGQGIHSALEGAYLLAEEAIPLLLRDSQADVYLGRYTRRLRARVRGRHLVQHMIEAVVSRSRLADSFVSRLARRPAVVRALLATTGDLASATSLFSPAVLLALAGPPTLEAHLS